MMYGQLESRKVYVHFSALWLSSRGVGGVDGGEDRMGSRNAVHHQVVVVGGGNAGLSVVARLQRLGVTDIGIVEPSETHDYQPLWTLVGGGRAAQAESRRPQASLMPRGVEWIKDWAVDIDPVEQQVHTDSGGTVGYDYLVVAPGIQLDLGVVPGMAAALDTPAVSSTYLFHSAAKTWENIRALRSGRALFTMPAGPITCAGAPQKIAYLAADHWRREGVLDDIEVTLVVPTPSLFAIKVFADELSKIADRYGIAVRTSSELIAVDPDARTAVIRDHAAGAEEVLGYDLLHTVPPQSAPGWLKRTPLADPTDPAGYVEVDRHTLQHARYANVYALGDAGSTPNAKTSTAIRQQAPVLAANLDAVMRGREPQREYGGYACCPLTTARDRMLLAEFDYSMQATPSIPFVDTTRERRDLWHLMRRGLPFLYWNLILNGLA
jgi:sulfide:quinone oxidoreductase